VSRRPRTRSLVVVGIFVSLLLAGVVSWYASSSPDGLNRVAQDQGFSHTTQQHATVDSPLAGYGKGAGNGRVSGGMAGVIGVAVTGVVMGGLVLLLRRRSTRSPASPPSPTSATDLPDTDHTGTDHRGTDR
jgi:hypothetical protein